MKHYQQLCGAPLTVPRFPTFLTFFLMKLLSFCICPQEFTSLIFIDMSHELDPLSQVFLWWPWVSGTLKPLLKNKLAWERSCHTHKLCSSSSSHCLLTYPPASIQLCVCFSFRNVWLFTVYTQHSPWQWTNYKSYLWGRIQEEICSQRFQWDFSRNRRILG